MKKTFLSLSLLFAAALLFCEEITFSADSMSGRAGSKEDTTKLAGNALVVTETIEIKADSIELSGKEFRYVGASGNIKGSYKESNLEFECSELQYDRESKIVSLTGDVKLIDVDNEVTAGAQMIEYNSNTDIAVLQIQVELKQKKNVCTSAYAVYRKKEQMLELNGSAKVVQDDDSFAAQSITFNMDTEEIVMDGNVHGSVTDDGTKGKKNEGEESEEKEGEAAENVEDASEDGKESAEGGDEAVAEKSEEKGKQKKKSKNKKKKEQKDASEASAEDDSKAVSEEKNE